jgi:predicted O-methyltransferase YrrM
MKNYTEKWNGGFITNTNSFVKNIDLCLEIGCFEGMTSNYIVDNILTENGKLICIDPLTDIYLNDNLRDVDIEMNQSHSKQFKDQYSRFINNVEEHLESGKIELIRDLSINAFDNLKKYKFDFIYIDGDHRAEGVYIDAINSFELCKKDGFILFDDYEWNDTGIGIDRFLDEYKDRYILHIKSGQVLIQKISDEI